MSDSINIETADRKRIATKWIVITMGSLHAWAFLFALALVIKDSPSEVLGAAFGVTTTGIGLTLAVLLFDRAADVVINRFAGPPAPIQPMTRTVTETVVPAPAVTPPATEIPGDATINVAGNANVQDSKSA